VAPGVLGTQGPQPTLAAYPPLLEASNLQELHAGPPVGAHTTTLLPCGYCSFDPSC
jgi:hypothetical protein